GTGGGKGEGGGGLGGGSWAGGDGGPKEGCNGGGERAPLCCRTTLYPFPAPGIGALDGRKWESNQPSPAAPRGGTPYSRRAAVLSSAPVRAGSMGAGRPCSSLRGPGEDPRPDPAGVAPQRPAPGHQPVSVPDGERPAPGGGDQLPRVEEGSHQGDPSHRHAMPGQRRLDGLLVLGEAKHPARLRPGRPRCAKPVTPVEERMRGVVVVEEHRLAELRRIVQVHQPAGDRQQLLAEEADGARRRVLG